MSLDILYSFGLRHTRRQLEAAVDQGLLTYQGREQEEGDDYWEVYQAAVTNGVVVVVNGVEHRNIVDLWQGFSCGFLGLSTASETITWHAARNIRGVDISAEV